MRQFRIAALLLMALVLSCSGVEEKTDLADESEKMSYALGKDFASRELVLLKEVIDLPSFVQGLKDTLQGRVSLMSNEEFLQMKEALAKKKNELRNLERKRVADKNKADGEAFLARNQNKDGVITTDSGLQYEVIKTGDGPRVKRTDRVTVHYKGTLIDGTAFDSSYDRNRPATFEVTGVIRGWTEALQLMNVGSHFRLYIPSDLAYGSQDRSAKIRANSTLIFDVEVLGIEGATKP